MARISSLHLAGKDGQLEPARHRFAAAATLMAAGAVTRPWPRPATLAAPSSAGASCPDRGDRCRRFRLTAAPRVTFSLAS